MMKLRKNGETYRGSKGTYLITKGFVDKYALFINEGWHAKTGDEIITSFKFLQEFQFKKTCLARMEEIDYEFINSRPHLEAMLKSGLISQEDFESKIGS